MEMLLSIQIGDDHTDKDHQHDQVALARRILFCDHLTTPQMNRLHAATQAGASDGRLPHRAPRHLHRS